MEAEVKEVSLDHRKGQDNEKGGRDEEGQRKVGVEGDKIERGGNKSLYQSGVFEQEQ